MKSQRATEARLRREVKEKLDAKNKRLVEVRVHLQRRQVRLSDDSASLTDLERLKLVEQEAEFRAEERELQAEIETLSDELKLYRPLGRPKPTINLRW